MLAAQRQALILEQVRRSGGVRVTELVESLDVSDMTVRRDLDVLEARGLLRKVHGGALAPHRHSTEEPGFEANATCQEDEKRAIAAAAAGLVEPGSAIGVSAGTTTWALAHHLREIPGLTVVTNCLRVADVFYRSPRSDQTVVLVGGLRTPSDALVGPLAVAAVRSLHLDTLLMGVHGIDPQAGLTTPNLMEGETDQALVEAARRLIVVADHTKWETVGLCTIAPLERCDVLVTDAGLHSEARRRISERVGGLIVAEEVDEARPEPPDADAGGRVPPSRKGG
ncbi:DeoR/GlpR family DNA-binding transcription regulator [Streptomonospora wellingtoniae]|uniref:DeoR/GlpR family DNA-binding transcription regulator n=1 Tax=Streptomonospora wellingtoniae TaxID=3075544 RepID=A0ABU2KWT1_9ACTN|nr:DeoR/GlpR family DNA-binding transcription regulator [Streptomonospora sp. DSM 45055]MDT0303708.1 DeoR/GlpR family DNA-binding transcription regulator [Streptomonospora sp. DSM 45055]